MFLNHIAHTAARKWTEAKTMKTHEEIKKGLEYCASVSAPCEICPFRTGTGAECIRHMSECALAYIQQLENQIGELTEKVEQLESVQPKWISVD